MPAKSKAQQKLMAMALNNPQDISAENSGVLDMSRGDLKDFASTSLSGLPQKVGKPHKNSLRGINTKAVSAKKRNALKLPKLPSLPAL